MELGVWKAVATGAVLLGAIAWSEHITAYNPPPGPVHIVYWEKWTDFEFKAIKDVVDEFNRTHKDIHVDLLSISGIQDKTLMAVAGNMPPDVAGLYGANVAQYVDDHAILNLDDYCKEAGIKADQYVPAYFDIGVYNGHIYALPSTPACTALHYNKDLFAAAGLDPNNPPKTIEELDDDCDKMLIKKDDHILRQGFMPGEPGWWNFMWGYFFGGKLCDDKGNITANSPENIRAYEWIQSFSKKYGTQSLQSFRSGLGGFDSAQNGFMAGKVGMELQGVWMYNFITKYNPDMHWAAVEFPYPANRPDLKGITIADMDILVIPRGAKHPKEAFEFIKYVESQKGMEMLCLGQKKNSPLISVSQDFLTKHPNPFIKLFTEMPLGKNTVAVPKMGIWPEYADDLSAAFDEVVLLQKTPKQALDEVQAKIQHKYDEHMAVLRQRGEAQ